MKRTLMICLIMSTLSCRQTPPENTLPDPKAFDRVIDGKQVRLYTLRNGNMTACITNYGGRLVSLVVPDKTGEPVNVVIGFADLDGYIHSSEPYFGATIGRYGNRIAKGQFMLNGQPYQLTINNGSNTLHGGKQGFQYKVFDSSQPDEHTLILRYLSKDGEEGFPGNLKATITYTLTEAGELKIDYAATTDGTTVVNLTNHAFFNLNGEGSGSIAGHRLRIAADRYTQVDSTLIPTGELADVTGTPFDFRKGFAIGARINDHSQQLRNGKGYDHNFVLNKHNANTAVADVVGDKSGMVMKVYTDQPGLQFYSGNFMQSKNQMRGYKDDFRTAFALETQHFPDSPNEPTFPTTVLKPGNSYHSQTIYKFSVN